MKSFILPKEKTITLQDCSNYLEVCKNRDLGVMDYFVGLHYEVESKRLLNEPFENKNYGWQEIGIQSTIQLTETNNLNFEDIELTYMQPKEDDPFKKKIKVMEKIRSKKTEINLKKDGYNFNCNNYPARSHYKFIMSLGRVFPTTKAQAKYFITEGICLDVLNGDDVETVETMLNKHGFEGDYKFTKSKRWVRLQNQSDLHEALKKEYSL